MNEIVEQIHMIVADLFENLGKAGNGNKAAAARARKQTLELEKLFKAYRKESVAAGKK